MKFQQTFNLNRLRCDIAMKQALKDCQHTFKRRPKTDCSCSIPGQELRCEHCPHFEQFLDSVKQKTEKLKNLSQTQLEGLL